MTKPEMVAKLADQAKQIQDLQDCLGKLEDMVINLAQDFHALEKRLEIANDHAHTWEG